MSLLLLVFHILVRPMNTQVNGKIELANEIIIYTSVCMQYLLTSIIQGPFVRWIIGFVGIGLTYLCFAINGLLILTVIMRRLKLV